MPKFLQIIFAIVFMMFTMSCGAALAQEPQATAAYGRKIDAGIVTCRNNELSWNHLSHYDARHMRAPYEITGPDGHTYTMQAHENFTTICRTYVKKIAALSAASATAIVTTQPAAKPVETAQQSADTPRRLTHNELVGRILDHVKIEKQQAAKIAAFKSIKTTTDILGVLAILSLLFTFLYFRSERNKLKVVNHDYELNLSVARTAARTATELAEARARDCASLTRQLVVMEQERNDAHAEIERLKSQQRERTQTMHHSAFTLPPNPQAWREKPITNEVEKPAGLIDLMLSNARFKEIPEQQGSLDFPAPNRLIQLLVYLDDNQQPMCNFFVPDSGEGYGGRSFEYTSDQNALGEALCRDDGAIQAIRKRGLTVVRAPTFGNKRWFTKPPRSARKELLLTREQVIKKLGGKVSEA